MSRAEIYIEDSEDGNVEVAVRYLGGGNPDSKAHQLANIIRKHMDDVMQPVGDAREEVTIEPNDDPEATQPGVENSTVPKLLTVEKSTVAPEKVGQLLVD